MVTENLVKTVIMNIYKIKAKTTNCWIKVEDFVLSKGAEGVKMFQWEISKVEVFKT